MRANERLHMENEASSCSENAWILDSRVLPEVWLDAQALTAGTLIGLSDILAQKLSSKAPLNWRRTLSVAVSFLLR